MENTHSFKIKEHSWLAAMAAWKLRSKKMAMVFGDTIHLHGASREEFLSNEEWFQHELCHICQYKRYGSLRFIILYLWESIKKGYRNNRFEVEARNAAVIKPSSLRP